MKTPALLPPFTTRAYGLYAVPGAPTKQTTVTWVIVATYFPGIPPLKQQFMVVTDVTKQGVVTLTWQDSEVINTPDVTTPNALVRWGDDIGATLLNSGILTDMDGETLMLPSSGGSYLTLGADTVTGTDSAFIFPAQTGKPGQVLKLADSKGGTVWSDAPTNTVVSQGTSIANAIALWDDATGTLLQGTPSGGAVTVIDGALGFPGGKDGQFVFTIAASSDQTKAVTFRLPTTLGARRGKC